MIQRIPKNTDSSARDLAEDGSAAIHLAPILCEPGPSEPGPSEPGSSACQAIAERQQIEVARGERFAFGSNWTSFLKHLDEARIQAAEQSLRQMLHLDDLQGRTFLDVGSGSGLFSLAAVRLGARHVHSFDFDPQCVACAESLRERFCPAQDAWTIELGDVLTGSTMDRLGQFDVVYSWGVLHQTGRMWQAMEHVASATRPGGRLYLSIYNYQPWLSPFWTRIKRIYNGSPRVIRHAMVLGYLAVKTPLLWLRDGRVRKDAVSCPPRSRRGMTNWHDAVDWVGGYPFQTATPEAVIRFFHQREYQLLDLSTVCGGSGCNEFVFQRAGRPVCGSSN